MTKSEFKEIVQTKGALGEGEIIDYEPALYQENNLTYIRYTINLKNCMKANWSNIQDRIKYTIKELKEEFFNAKVSLFTFKIFNGPNNKFYQIVLIVKGFEYRKLPER